MLSRNQPVNFTERQSQVFRLMVLGSGYSKDIAKALNISPTTVNYHRLQIIEKTGAKTAVEALRWALKNGVVKVEEL